MFKLWAFHGYSLWSWGPSLLILLFLVFWGFFNCENCWIFSNVFSTFIEIITWFLDFFLFTCYAYTYSFISSFDFSPRFQIAHSNIITQVSKRHLTLYIFKVELLIDLLGHLLRWGGAIFLLLAFLLQSPWSPPNDGFEREKFPCPKSEKQNMPQITWTSHVHRCH